MLVNEDKLLRIGGIYTNSQKQSMYCMIYILLNSSPEVVGKTSGFLS